MDVRTYETSSEEVWGCLQCDMDFQSEGALRQHRRDAEAHKHRCCKCSKVFPTMNALNQHLIVHKQRNLDCWGSQLNCDKTFKSPAHIFLHLQTGSCKSRMTHDELMENIMKCDGPWKNPEYEYDEDALPFQCPTCDRLFEAISSFLQHVESPSCEEGYDSGRLSAWGLLRQLRRNLNLDKLYMLGREV